MVFREFIDYTFFAQPALYIVIFIFCWSISIQNNYVTPGTS
jgi:hypothetical protein